MATDQDAKIEALQAEVEQLRDVLGIVDGEESDDALLLAYSKQARRTYAAESRARAAEGELWQVREAVKGALDSLGLLSPLDANAGDVQTEYDRRLRAVLASVPDETTQPATTDDCAGEGRTCETHGAPWVMSDSGLYIVCEAAELGRPASPVVAPSATDEEGAMPGQRYSDTSAQCLLTDPHLVHVWWYTSEGGGHMLSQPEEGARRWECPGIHGLPAPVLGGADEAHTQDGDKR